MFTDLPTHAQRPPLEIPWLASLPLEWREARGKQLFSRVQRPPKPSDEVVTCFRDGTVTLRKNRRTSGFTEAEKEHGYQRILRGDLVIHAMDAFAGAAGVSDSDGKATPVYTALVPRGDANSHYYAHVVRELARRGWIQAQARGVRERSTDYRHTAFANEDLPLPPVDEQAAIVKYLEHAHARIDRAIAAKRKMIALLEEQKQAVIHQAVTRGLDTGVQLKDSGIPWLGEVNSKTSVIRLRHLLSEPISYGANLSAEPFDPELPRYLRVTDFGFDGKLRADTARSLNWQAAKACLVRPGDILIARTGTVGKSFMVPEHAPVACHAGYLVRVRTASAKLDQRYLDYFLKSPGFSRWKDSVLIQSTVPNISAERYSNLPVPVPSLETQRRVVEFLDHELSVPERAVQRLLREIELLREFRTRLTSDVVTGQVDVRAVAANLPDLAEDSLAAVTTCADEPIEDVAEEFLEGEPV